METAGKRIRRGLLAAAAMSAMAAISSPATVVGAGIPPPGQKPEASIGGVVRDEGGNVVSGARIILWPASGVPAGADPDTYTAPEARSSNDGTFRVPVDADVFHVLVRLPGYRWGHRLGVRAGLDESINVGAITLRRGVSIVGRVVYGDGPPVAGINIHLRNNSDDPVFLPDHLVESPMATTNLRGEFRFDGLAPGRSVSLAIEFDPPPIRYESVTAPDIGEPEAEHEIVLNRFPDGAELAVEVVSDSGEPIERAQLHIWRVPQRPVTGGIVLYPRFIERPGGRYVAAQMEPGLHRVSVYAPLHRPQERDDIELAAGDSRTIRFELERVPSTAVPVILTTAKRMPVPGHEVHISRIGSLPTEPRPAPNSGLDVGYRHEDVFTDDAGEHVFDDVPQGRYRVFAVDHALGRATRDVEVIPGMAPVVLSFPEAAGPIGAIHIEVVDGDGNPVPSANVYVERESRPRRTSERGLTGADGTFTFEALVDDAVHEFHIDGIGYKSLSVKHRLNEESVDREFMFTLEERDTPGTSTVTGRIVGLDPAVLHRVTLSKLPSYVRADGSFVIGSLSSGQHELSIYADGWSGVEVPFTVTISRDGETVDVGDVVFAGVRISGTVYYKGELLQAGSARLSPPGRGAGGSAELINGRFAIGPVNSGRYHLIIHYDGWGRIHDEVIDAESDVDVDLDLHLGAAMASGTVADAETGEPIAEARMQIGYVCEHPDCTWRSHERPGGLETGPDGRWRGGPLEAGTWLLRLAKPGYVPLAVNIEVDGGIDVEVPIEMTPTPGLDLVFETSSGLMPNSVTAKLLDNAGNEVARETVYEYYGLSQSHWDGAPPGTWTLESYGRYARAARQRVTIPGPPATVDLPMDGLMLARIPALEETITLGILVILDADKDPVTGYLADGTPVNEWIAPGSGEIYARRLPPGTYTARVTSGDRVWEEEFEILPFALTTVTLRGVGR